MKANSIAVCAVLLASSAAARGADQTPKSCTISFSSPKPGDQVSKSGEVTGSAKIPPKTFLWVLAHRKDYAAEWWPQMGRPALIEDDGTWVMIVGYGEKQDVGKAFEVALVVVDASTNTRLKEWSDKAKQTGQYPPMEFPTTIDGCPAKKVIVTKVSH